MRVKLLTGVNLLGPRSRNQLGLENEANFLYEDNDNVEIVDIKKTRPSSWNNAFVVVSLWFDDDTESTLPNDTSAQDDSECTPA